GLTRRSDIHAVARLALRLESGLNDAVLLPIVIVAMAFLNHGAPQLGKIVLSVALLGPLAGVGCGVVAGSALTFIRKRFGVRRGYEAIFSPGVAFAAYAAADALHGSGFLAAFAAGLTIVVLDVELCDCFLEYGETTAEMALLFTFVLFGASSIWSAFQAISPAALTFAVAVLLLRPIVFAASLLGSGVDRKGKLLIGWFGPRGLSSLLLVLLPVFARMPGSIELFQLCSLVVLLSVVVHGGSLIVLRRRVPPAEAAPAPAPAPVPAPDVPVRIGIPEAAALPNARFVDVRTERSASESKEQIRGSVRVDPAADVVGQVRRLAIRPDEPIILYCA